MAGRIPVISDLGDLEDLRQIYLPHAHWKSGEARREGVAARPFFHFAPVAIQGGMLFGREAVPPVKVGRPDPDGAAEARNQSSHARPFVEHVSSR
ncbi:hypothetical protein [Allosediminivita pacifica]|uniref:hypothetical protein n=1 Tax=Allosediminivita pacifica TaxID=1267769 RepID=UPI0011B28FBA|nr:hypothetical protein [Allosediminivita pacifica]GGB26580.1 hypothetical protein GCM10011324_40470 [Allosediminivita pacifica]